MTLGFYEQLGVDPAASAAEIRAAYTRVVAQVLKRRKAVTDRGGDATPLDLARSQAEEAYKVLFDPSRRRRYDAMRAMSVEGFPTDVPGSVEAELWRRAAGALVHPAAGAAAELLRTVTTLKIGVMPPSPQLRPPPRIRSGHDEDVTVTSQTAPRAPVRARQPERTGETPTSAKTAPVLRSPVPRPAPRILEELPEIDEDDLEFEGSDDRVVALPKRGAEPEKPGFRVVDNPRTGSAPVMVMPTPSARAGSSSTNPGALNPTNPGASSSSGVRVGSPPTNPGTGRPTTPPAVPPSARVTPMAPPAAPRKKPLSAEDVARLVDKHGYSGALLKGVREAKGLSLQEMSDTTRITVRYLEAIEGEQQDGLPSSTFVRGYVREMARLLSLDEESTVSGYMRRLGR